MTWREMHRGDAVFFFCREIRKEVFLGIQNP